MKHMAQSKKVAHDVKGIRDIFDLSQQDLAHALGVARFTITRWEQSNNEPTGLQREVLCALRTVANSIDPTMGRMLGDRIRLGIGHLLAGALEVLVATRRSHPGSTRRRTKTRSTRHLPSVRRKTMTSNQRTKSKP